MTVRWVVGAVDCTFPAEVSVGACGTLADVAGMLLEWFHPDPTAEGLTQQERAVLDGTWDEIREMVSLAESQETVRGSVGETWVVTIRRTQE